MPKQKTLDAAALAEQAQNSKEKEAYLQMEKAQGYRIGVGARAPSPTTPSFFVEVVISLFGEDGEVNLKKLENALTFLKMLKSRGYALAHEGGNCISCETTMDGQRLAEEFWEIRKLAGEAHL